MSAAAPMTFPLVEVSASGKVWSSKDGVWKSLDGLKKNANVSKWLIAATISSALGCAVPAGFNLSVLNVPQTIFQEFCNKTIHQKYDYTLSPSELNLLWAFVVSVFVVGGIIGAGSAGWVLNIMGRKRALLFNQLFGVAAAILFLSSKAVNSVEMIILGRLLVGFYSGFTCSAVPVYLTEIAPTVLRGALGVVQNFGLTVGILLAQILGFRYILGNEENWHILTSIFCIPILIFSVVIYFCPESPKYLYIVKEQQDAALAELVRLRGVPATQLQIDMLELREEMKIKQTETSWSLQRLLFSREARLPLLLLCCLQAGQQLSGINAVFYYSTSIFTSSGLSEQQSQLASVGASIINAVMAGLALILVSKFGRRKLLITSLSSVIICLVVLTVALSLKTEVQWMSYVAVVALLSYVLSFGVGLGPIPYFIGSELFQQGPKPAAMSIGCWMNWTGNFVVGMSFPPLQGIVGEYCFIGFATIAFIVLIFIYNHLPETKDKDPIEVAKLFKTGSSLNQRVGESYPMVVMPVVHPAGSMLGALV